LGIRAEKPKVAEEELSERDAAIELALEDF
jgi:hypothetical protein